MSWFSDSTCAETPLKTIVSKVLRVVYSARAQKKRRSRQKRNQKRVSVSTVAAINRRVCKIMKTNPFHVISKEKAAQQQTSSNTGDMILLDYNQVQKLTLSAKHPLLAHDPCMIWEGSFLRQRARNKAALLTGPGASFDEPLDAHRGGAENNRSHQAF